MAFCRSLATLPDGIGELQQLAVLDIRSVGHMYYRISAAFVSTPRAASAC